MHENNSNAIDLSNITAGNSEAEIRHPKTQEPIGLTIVLRPSSSPEVQAIKRRMTNESLRTRGKSMTAEKVEANALDMLVAAVESWRWADGVTWKGERPDPTPVNVRKVLRDAPWIKSQIDDAFGDDAAFFQS